MATNPTGDEGPAPFTKSLLGRSFGATPTETKCTSDGSRFFLGATVPVGLWQSAPAFASIDQITTGGIPTDQIMIPACSSNASVIYAAQYNSPPQVWVSLDNTATWSNYSITDTDPIPVIHSMCCSANGQIAYVLKAYGKLFKSTDYGQTWGSPIQNFGSGQDLVFQRVCCSADGCNILVSKASGAVYNKVSRNGGTTFSDITSVASTATYTCAAISANGCNLVLGQYDTDFNVYISINNGNSWTNYKTTVDPVNTYTFQSAAFSSNGSTLFLGTTTNGFMGTYSGGSWAFESVLSGSSFPQLCCSYTGNPAYFSISDGGGVYLYGYGSFPLTIEPGVSYYRLSNATGYSWQEVILPSHTSVEPGRIIHFTRRNDKNIGYRIRSEDSSFIHDTTGNWSFLTVCAGPSNWLRLGARDLYGLQDFHVNFVSTLTIYPTTVVNTRLAEFVQLDGSSLPFESTLNVTAPTAYISSLVTSSFTFLNAAQYPMSISSSTLLYRGSNLALDTQGELLQTLTF